MCIRQLQRHDLYLPPRVGNAAAVHLYGQEWPPIPRIARYRRLVVSEKDAATRRAISPYAKERLPAA
jgi:hypothetical protein